MAEGKKTFIFYSDWINMIREMDNEDAGELLKHILMYVNDEKPTTENKFVRMAFGHMKPLIKSDLIKWEGIREKRKEAGAKGGKANAKQKQANAKQVEAVNDNVNVDTKVSTKEKIDVDVYEDYKNRIGSKESDGWRDTFYMGFSFKHNSLSQIIDDFIIHHKLSYEEPPKDLPAFKRHLKNWCSIVEPKGNLNKYLKNPVREKGAL